MTKIALALTPSDARLARRALSHYANELHNRMTTSTADYDAEINSTNTLITFFEGVIETTEDPPLAEDDPS